MRKERGITLVSLVVTIIILIILAGISINLTLGENGIITKSKQAKEKTEQAKLNEETALNELYMQIEEGTSSGNISYDAIAKLEEFKTIIASAITNQGIQTSSTSSANEMAENIEKLNSNQIFLYEPPTMTGGAGTYTFTIPNEYTILAVTPYCGNGGFYVATSVIDETNNSIIIRLISAGGTSSNVAVGCKVLVKNN